MWDSSFSGSTLGSLGNGGEKWRVLKMVVAARVYSCVIGKEAS